MKLQVDPTLQNKTMPVDSNIINLPGNAPPLNWLYLYIAGSCNLACRHCWIAPNYFVGGKGGLFVPLEYVDKAIHEGLPLGLKSVKLSGGEPTLHPQFREIVKMIDQAGIRITMETNGTLLNKSLANFIKDTPNFAFISVSLDSVDATTHESLRMIPGSFDQAIEGIKNLVNLGIYPQLICTLFQGNQKQIHDIIVFAEDLGCSSIKFNHLQTSGRGENLAKLEGLSVPDLIDIYHHITDDLVTEFRIPVVFDIPFAFFPLKNLLKDSLGRCHVINILGMLSNGDLSLCGIGETKPDLVYGNIGHSSLAEIWCNSEGLQQLRELIPAKLEGVCGNCLHRDFCMGSCVANNYYETGKLNSAYYFCAQANEAGLFPSTRYRLEN